jgi:hypothetical protein
MSRTIELSVINFLDVVKLQKYLDFCSAKSAVEYGDDSQIKPLDHSIRVSNLSSFDNTFEELCGYNIGGSGDCFFRAVNFALWAENTTGMRYQLISPKAWYQYLSLPVMTHITEEHIPAISNRLRTTIVVYSVHVNTMSIQRFGDYPSEIRIVELNHEHYVSVPRQSKPVIASLIRSQMMIEPPLFDFTDRMQLTLGFSHPVPTPASDKESIRDQEESSGQGSSDHPSDSSDDSSSEPSEDEQPTPSPFEEENDPRYKEEVTIDYFIKFCYSIASTAKDSMKLTNVDSKLYYKLRHNLFKTYCLSALGITSTKEVPFSSFPELCLDSPRTPDYLSMNQDYCLLIEFTVASRKEAALLSKDYFTKYHNEIKSSKITIRDFYLVYTLDSDMEDVIAIIHEIASLNGAKLNPNFTDELEDVSKAIRAVTAYFNDFCPQILSMNVDQMVVDNMPSPIDTPPLFHDVQNLKGKKAVRKVRVNNLIMRYQRRLTIAVRKRPDYGTYKITVNFVTSSCYIRDHSHGLTKDQLINILELGSIPEEAVDIIGDYYVESTIFQGVEKLPDPIKRDRDVTVSIDTSVYEEKMYASLHKNKMTTISDKETSTQHLNAQKLYMDSVNRLNTDRTQQYKSSPFIFYPCAKLEKGEFELELETDSFFMNTLSKVAKGKMVSQSRQIDRTVDYGRLDALNTKTAKMGRALKMKYTDSFRKYTRLNQRNFEKEYAANPDLSDVAEYRKVLNDYTDVVIEKTRLAYKNRVRINLKVDSRWDNETEHFRKPTNVHTIVTGLDHNEVSDKYKSFLEELLDPTHEKTSDSVLSETLPLGSKLAENCAQMKSMLDTFEDDFRKTLLGHSTLLTSQLCYSLMYYSNIKLNKDDFMYDNLGYKDVLLIVKGGKKIRSTRVSRFFRILFPITLPQAKICESHTNRIFVHDGRHYLMTPWRMLRMAYLKKGFELYHNVGCYYASARSEYNLDISAVNHFISIKILLMFSQKRSLEVWSSTLRYIYLNSLGTHTDLMSLIPDMAMRDSDSLTFLFQRCFCMSLPEIYRHAQMNKLYDILWQDSIDNFDLAAERFEESSFMARSPFNPVAEHLKNLKSVLDTHDYFMTNVGSTDPMEILDKTNIQISDGYYDKLEACDFNFDAKASFIVGDYCGKYISTTYSKNDLIEEFNNIMSETYTTIASGKGMRDTEDVFWGQKGYDVVFSKFEVNVPDLIDNFPKKPSDFSKCLSESEVTFFKQIAELKSHDLIFDMKDKEQYKGSREIYVMTKDTKTMQNPLEKFFKKLCKALPNELIHKPSSSRPKFIHSKIFEHSYDTKSVMYCTMDCRKWAPRSNLWKYYFFVKGMSNYLPENFVSYFMSVWALMFKKTIRIQTKFVDLLKTNEGYRHMVEKYLKKIDDETYELLMPYSFMMGIFNYLSSLMHAASQLYFTEKIADRFGATCNFLAHSDDSGGIIVSENYKKCVYVFSMYEKFQRSLNHLMSRKKCCLSKRSFEMISIMYNDQRFIPMVHKFITNVSFDPSGSGWYSDICNVVSKVVDLYNNGGSLLQCYCMMLTLSELYRKAYHLPRNELLSHVPISLGGVFNLHPIHLIMVGSSSQECLLDLVQTEEERSKRISFYVTLCGDYSIGMGSKLQYRVPYYKRHKDMVILDETQKPKLEAISALPYRTTLMDYLKHINRLYEPKYVFSLTGVDINQITLSTLFYTTEVSGLSGTSYKLRDVLSLYQASFLSDKVQYYRHEYPKSGYTSYFRQVESMKYDFDKVVVESTKSCKPVRYNTIENFGLRLSQENLMILSAIEKWSGIKDVLTNSDKYDSMKKFCLRALPGSLEDKLSYLKNFDPSEKEDRMRSGYLFMPSNIKVDNVSRFFACSLLYTSRRYFISKQKPQMFTPSDLNNFDQDNSDLQHLSICYKILQRTDCGKQEIDRLNASLSKCPTCRNKEETLLDFKLMSEMQSRPEFEEFHSDLPYVDYVTTQSRGSNVWFSTCDFDVVTKFGTVESRARDGRFYTTWKVADANNLPRLWQYFTQVCKSRGLTYNSFTYSDTGFKFPRLAFNSFESPYVPALYGRAMILPDSIVLQGSVQYRRIHRRGRGFYMDSRPVDFCLYSVYDVNQLFFDSHALSGIRSLLYDIEVEIPKEEVMKNFTSSKLYHLLMNDDCHVSSVKDKYQRNGFLGQPGSFTRALVVSDEKGDTRYRSSYNPQYFTKGVIEFDTVEGVPVVDMFEKMSMARLTTFERNSFGRAMEGLSLSSMDKQNLIRVKNKMGLESLGTSITLYKHVMRGMMASSTHLLPDETVLGILKLMLNTIHSCMSDYPREGISEQYWGKPRSFWSTLLTIITNKLDYAMIPELMALGLIRAKNDNQDRFWHSIRDDALLSCLIVNSRYFGNLVLFIRGMLAKPNVEARFHELLYDGNTPKYRHLALAKNFYRDIDADNDLVNDIYLKEGEPFVLNEMALDMLTAGDTLEDFLDEAESGDELEERNWEGDKLRYTVFCREDMKKAMQETAMSDFSRITIMSPVEFVCFPWLGKGDYEKKNIRGMDFYVSTFPGEQDFPSPPKLKIVKVETREFREVAKINPEELGEIMKTKHVPKAIKDRDEAMKIFKEMGIFIPEIFTRLYPNGGSIQDWIQEMVSEFKNMGGFDEQKVWAAKRERFRYHLPGFQGIVKDSRLKAEVEAMFGPNGHYLFSGNVRLTESTFKQLMRTIKRIYNRTDSEGRAKLLFIISTLLDTVPSQSSDAWYMDSVTEIIEELESALDEEDDIIMMPVPTKSLSNLTYREKDPFE